VITGYNGFRTQSFAFCTKKKYSRNENTTRENRVDREKNRDPHTHTCIYKIDKVKINLANGMNGKEFEGSKIDYGNRMFDDAVASFYSDKCRIAVTFRKMPPRQI